jgi:FMN phosphatase YigB (HAD superfamily)
MSEKTGKIITMLKAVLFDLDDTLLKNPMEAFVPAYFQALTRYAAHLVPPDRLVSSLIAGMRAMGSNDGTGPTNEEVFSKVFYPAVGLEAEVLKPVLFEFYADVFPRLKPLTRPAPKSRALVEWAFAQDLQVAVATNPVFPLPAVEQRLAWADVPKSEFDYALVTSMENSRALKPNPAYYRGILTALGRSARECLMVGDDWAQDMVPASSIGIPVFWIAAADAPLPDANVPLFGRGPLSDLWRLSRSKGLLNRIG